MALLLGQRSRRLGLAAPPKLHGVGGGPTSTGYGADKTACT